MPKPHEEAADQLMKAHLSKSKEKLKAAKRLFALKSYEDAISRAYYGAFHAAQAVLLTEGFEADTHQGLVSQFSLRFVKTGRVARKFGRFLAELKDDREKSDYEIYSVATRKEASLSLQEAAEFIRGMEKYLEKGP